MVFVVAKYAKTTFKNITSNDDVGVSSWQNEKKGAQSRAGGWENKTGLGNHVAHCFIKVYHFFIGSTPKVP